MAIDTREDPGEFYNGGTIVPKPGRIAAPVESVNGRSGDVVLDATAVGAVAANALEGETMQTNTMPNLREAVRKLGEALGARVICLAMIMCAGAANGAGLTLETVPANNIDFDANPPIVTNATLDTTGLATAAELAAAAGAATNYADSVAQSAINYTDSTAAALRDAIAGKADATNIYTKAEMDAAMNGMQRDIAHYGQLAENAVSSVNGKTGNAVTLDAKDIDILMVKGNVKTNIEYAVNSLDIEMGLTFDAIGRSLSGKQDNLPYPTNAIPYAAITGKPTNVSAFVNDAGYLNTESDPVWAAEKGGYATTSALAGKADDNAVVHLTGDQQTMSAVLQLMYTLYAESGIESHGDYRQTWGVDNDFAGELVISQDSIYVRLADEYEPRYYRLQAGGGGTVALLENIAPAFVYLRSYGVDELCTSFDADPNHKGYWLYKCIVATDGSTPPETDTTHWTPATVEDVLAALRTAIAGKANRASPATAGNLAALDANGSLVDSGKSAADFAAAGDLAAAAVAATNYTDAATNAIPKFSEKDVVKVYFKDGENYPSYVDGRGELWEIGDLELGGHWVATGGPASSQGTYNYAGHTGGVYGWTLEGNYITYDTSTGVIVHNGSTSTNTPEPGKDPEVIGTTFPTCHNIWASGRTITYYPMAYQYDSKGRFALSNALSQVAFTGNYNDLTNKPSIPTVPANVSAFNNDAGYLTGYTETDPTVPAWAKAASKPAYTYSEITGKPTFATVATSGSYNDLTDKPTIPSPTAPVASATLAWQSNGSAIVVSVGAAGTLSATLTGWIEGQTQTALITLAAGASVSSEVKLVGYGTWPTGGQFLASATRVGNNVYVTPIVLVN